MHTLTRRVAVLGVALGLAACASPNRDDYLRYQVQPVAAERVEARLAIEIDPAQPVDFRGEFSHDDSITTGNPLYAGDAGLVGLAVQVAAHAAISSSMQDSRMRKQQDAANKVLMPWQDFLSTFTQNELVEASSLPLYASRADGDLVVASKPIFYMTRDTLSIFVKHLVQVHKPGATNYSYQNVIEMHTALAPSAGSAENAAALRAATLELYRESLQLAVADFRGEFAASDAPEQTFRFEQEGLTPRVERGQLLVDDCEQQVLRNLRGWLIAYRTGTQGDCPVRH